MKKIILIFAILAGFIKVNGQDIFNGCPLKGNAKGIADQETNKLKNRYTLPTASDIDPSITLEAMLAPGNDKNRFSQNKAASITGYVVHVAKKGSKETCNCHASDPMFTDTHIDIVLDPNHAGKRERVVVEITPRLRAIMLNKGQDWSPEALQKLKGKKVTFTGWLLWDWRHEKDAENTDPGDSAQNWRATCWEIHPVTDFEIQEDPLALVEDDERPVEVVFTSSVQANTNNLQGLNQAINLKNHDAGILLSLIVLGAILGMCGQVLRIFVGIKKAKESAAKEEKSTEITDVLKTKQLLFSLLIALIVGGVAGVFISLNMDGKNLSNAEIVAIITAGYAGTDFIEGILTGGK